MKPAHVALVLMAAMVAGCTFQGVAQPAPAPAADVALRYDDPIPGKWVLAIPADRLSGPVKLEGLGCKEHKFQVDAVDSFQKSASLTLGRAFENLTTIDTELTRGALIKSGYDGQVIVSVDRMEVIARPSPETLSSDAEISAAVRVELPKGRLLRTRFEADGEGTGDKGFLCDNSPAIIQESVEQAIRDVMTQVAEEVGNNKKLRAYASTLGQTSSLD